MTEVEMGNIMKSWTKFKPMLDCDSSLFMNKDEPSQCEVSGIIFLSNMLDFSHICHQILWLGLFLTDTNKTDPWVDSIFNSLNCLKEIFWSRYPYSRNTVKEELWKRSFLNISSQDFTLRSSTERLSCGRTEPTASLLTSQINPGNLRMPRTSSGILYGSHIFCLHILILPSCSTVSLKSWILGISQPEVAAWIPLEGNSYSS